MENPIKLTTNDEIMAEDINDIAKMCHENNVKWWRDPRTQEPIQRNRGEMLMLIVSEIAEALEGERKNLMDDKLPNRRMPEVELADAVIRIMDYCYGLGYDLGGAFVEKMRYNQTRVDHTDAARLQPNGKRF